MWLLYNKLNDVFKRPTSLKTQIILPPRCRCMAADGGAALLAALHSGPCPTAALLEAQGEHAIITLARCAGQPVCKVRTGLGVASGVNIARQSCMGIWLPLLGQLRAGLRADSWTRVALQEQLAWQFHRLNERMIARGRACC